LILFFVIFSGTMLRVVILLLSCEASTGEAEDPWEYSESVSSGLALDFIFCGTPDGENGTPDGESGTPDGESGTPDGKVVPLMVGEVVPLMVDGTPDGESGTPDG